MPRESRVVIFSGPAGSGTYQRMQEAAELAREWGYDVHIARLFDRMAKVALERYGLEITEENVLNLLRERLITIRKEAVAQLRREIESEPGFYMIRSPATFFWGGTLITGLDLDDVMTLRPDAFVVVVDDVMPVKERLASDPEWRTQRFTLRDIASWREQETAMVEELAKWMKAEFYVIARAHPPRVFADIVVHPQKPKAYLSFPMTHVPPDVFREFEAKKNRFIDELNELGIVIFDPATMVEGVLLSALEDYENKARKQGREPDPDEVLEVRVTYDGEEQVYRYTYQELASVDPLIEGQIVKRDFSMIEAANMVIVYNPLGIPSPGVACEMMYGHRVLGKDVYLIWGGEGRPSPFYTAFCNKRFATAEEFIEYAKSHVRPKWGG